MKSKISVGNNAAENSPHSILLVYYVITSRNFDLKNPEIIFYSLKK